MADCYCKPGDAYCGTCERCGAPGHTRHYPGARPYTGAWCDRCYRRIARFESFGGPRLYIALVIIAIAAAMRLLNC